MNEINNKFLLARDKFMTEMHLRQPRFIHKFVDHLQKKQRKNAKT